MKVNMISVDFPGCPMLLWGALKEQDFHSFPLAQRDYSIYLGMGLKQLRIVKIIIACMAIYNITVTFVELLF